REFFRHPEDVARAGLSGGLGGKRVIIQGFGNVGYHLAKFLQEEDEARIIAIIEKDGAAVNEEGLKIEPLAEYFREHRTFRGYPDATFVEDGKALLEAECDILVPAAIGAQITMENAGRIKARLIAEAANGPITYDADEYLRDRGKVI